LPTQKKKREKKVRKKTGKGGKEIFVVENGSVKEKEGGKGKKVWILRVGGHLKLWGGGQRKRGKEVRV